MFEVSLFYLKNTKLMVGTIHRFVSMYLPYFIKITVTNLNIFTILSALQTLEYDLFFFLDNTLISAK